MAFNLESASEATSGAIGALVSTTILYPLDTCKSKYQAEVRAHHQAKYRWIFLLPFQDFSLFPFFFFFCSLLDIFLGPIRDEFGFILLSCFKLMMTLFLFLNLNYWSFVLSFQELDTVIDQAGWILITVKNQSFCCKWFTFIRKWKQGNSMCFWLPDYR